MRPWIPVVSAGYLLLVFGVCLPALNDRLAFFNRPPGLTPELYQKNEQTRQVVEKLGSEYVFDYTFLDTRERKWRWQWSFERAATDQEISHYGIPSWIYEPYYPTPAEKARRREAIQGGLFKQDDEFVVPDYNKLVAHYRPFTLPLYQLLEDSARGMSRRDRIELVMKFVQDIPYGVPPEEHNRRVLNGILPPPHLFTERWGDCDSKAVLLASILSHDPSMDIVLLSVPGHMLMALADVPGPYQESLRYRGKTYVLVEATGPARFDYGDSGTIGYRSFQEITPIRASQHQNVHVASVSASTPAVGRNGRRPVAISQPVMPSEPVTQVASFSDDNYKPKPTRKEAEAESPEPASEGLISWSGLTTVPEPEPQPVAGDPEPIAEIAWADDSEQAAPKPVAEISWADDSTPESEAQPVAALAWVDDKVTSVDGMSVLATSRQGNLLRFDLAASQRKAIRAVLMSGNRVVEDAVIVQRKGPETQLLVLVNASGRYNINLFAKDRAGGSDYPFVMSIPFEHTIELGNNTDLSARLPSTFGRFSEEEVFVETPLMSPLPPNRAAEFKVRVLGAEDVAVTYGDDWVVLTRDGDWFSGSVPVPASGEIVILARFEGDEFNGLARYVVGQ